ncbi:MAG: molybdopterin-dependent oxidoreductase, partial [Myxococcales bacterium]|nr:molybdopterin-dependent oxidoreductase [Myxococcales bacterium]
PHTVPVLKESRASKMLIDPVWHKTARLCDAFVQPRPGGDFALAMAVARVLFEREWIDPAAASYCDHLAEFRALASSHSLDEWCAEADVTPAVAFDIATRLHQGPTAILVGWGMARRINGGAIVRALDALCAISGNLGIPGGGVSYYYWRRKTFDFGFIRNKPPRTILEPLLGPELLASGVRAVWITAGNPVAMLPESATSDRALRSREFVCVVDAWHTDTTRAATLVLPTTTLLEDDDLLGAYGHHYVGASRPVVPPPPGVKSDLEILQLLGERVGVHVLRGSPREWKERILRKDAGFSLTDLEEKGAQRSALSGKVLFADRKFKTASGKVNLITSAPERARVSAEYPLFLMALSTDKAQSSQWSKGQPKGPPVVIVHPDSAAGVRDGGFAVVQSAIGSLHIQIRHDPKQRRDVALMSKGGHFKDGRSANVLSRARATDLGGGGALYDEAVRIRL